VGFESNASGHETWSIWCHAGFHVEFTSMLHSHTSVGPSRIVWSELGPATPFPPMRVLEVALSYQTLTNKALSVFKEMAPRNLATSATTIHGSCSRALLSPTWSCHAPYLAFASKKLTWQMLLWLTLCMSCASQCLVSYNLFILPLMRNYKEC
jgi:hypothetical protein